MADEVNLVEVDPLEEINSSLSESVEYPCITVQGINTEEEVNFFRNRVIKTDNTLPLYIDFNGFLKRIGDFELELNNLLAIRTIGEYLFTIYQDKETSKILDFNNEVLLESFITF